MRKRRKRISRESHNITGEPMYRRARRGIAYLPQEPSVFRRLSVEQNLWAIMETRKNLSRDKKRTKLEELLENLGD